MNEKLFKYLMFLCAIAFTIIFCIVVMPEVIANPSIVNFVVYGFVNPISSGYSADTIICGVVLFIWVIYEAKNYGVKHGWICIILCFIPGVAVGFAIYLVLRNNQIQSHHVSTV